MNRTRRKCGAREGALLLLLAMPLSACAAGDLDDPRLEQSRALVKTFGMQLKAELKSSLEQGGAIQAVRVCKEVAPQIAAEISRQSGAAVTRTSLRYRNPANAPTDWQLSVLRKFDEQAKETETLVPMEYFATHVDGARRYMLAIRTDGVCLACHGEAIAPALLETLQIEYPDDRAVGYELGDVRGAFSVTWPAAGTTSGN